MRFALDRNRQQIWVDEMIDAHADWREECAALHDAYDRWANAPRDDRALAFASYVAALDNEEHASLLYARLVRRVGELVASPRHDRGPGR
jgi:hypothetical protein